MVLTHTIYNELSTNRNPNNMALIGVVFTTQPEAAAKVLISKGDGFIQFVWEISHKSVCIICYYVILIVIQIYTTLVYIVYMVGGQ